MASDRLFILIMIIIAFVVAIMGVLLPMHHLNIVMAITNFFDMMLPILAFAALIKYLIYGYSKKDITEKGKHREPFQE